MAHRRVEQVASVLGPPRPPVQVAVAPQIQVQGAPVGRPTVRPTPPRQDLIRDREAGRGTGADEVWTADRRDQVPPPAVVGPRVVVGRPADQTLGEDVNVVPAAVRLGHATGEVGTPLGGVAGRTVGRPCLVDGASEVATAHRLRPVVGAVEGEATVVAPAGRRPRQGTDAPAQVEEGAVGPIPPAQGRVPPVQAGEAATLLAVALATGAPPNAPAETPVGTAIGEGLPNAVRGIEVQEAGDGVARPGLAGPTPAIVAVTHLGRVGGSAGGPAEKTRDPVNVAGAGTRYDLGISLLGRRPFTARTLTVFASSRDTFVADI